MTASANMQYITPGRPIDKTLYINVVVVNVGDCPTTLTHFCGFTYKSWFHRLRRKRDKAFVINTGPESPIPHKIEVGEQWSAMALQDKAKELCGNSRLYIGVQHAMQSRPTLRFVQF